MLINKDNIEKYIPQREPFIMIDALLSADESGFQTQFLIKEDNLFLENGKLSESSIVENIAQTCAAGFGYLGSISGESEAKLGFIGAISKLEVYAHASLGDLIETHVDILNTFENIHLVEGIAKSNGKELVKCQMKIVQA